MELVGSPHPLESQSENGDEGLSHCSRGRGEAKAADNRTEPNSMHMWTVNRASRQLCNPLYFVDPRHSGCVDAHLAQDKHLAHEVDDKEEKPIKKGSRCELLALHREWHVKERQLVSFLSSQMLPKWTA